MSITPCCIRWKRLQKTGCGVTLVQPDKHGYVSPEEIRAALRPDTALISVMTANNELGTIQPIREIGAHCA